MLSVAHYLTWFSDLDHECDTIEYGRLRVNIYIVCHEQFRYATKIPMISDHFTQYPTLFPPSHYPAFYCGGVDRF